MQIKLSLDVYEHTAESGLQPLLRPESEAQWASANQRLSLADGKASKASPLRRAAPAYLSSAISAAMAWLGPIPSLGIVCKISRGFWLDPAAPAVS